MFGRDGHQLLALAVFERPFDRPVERLGRTAGEGEAATEQANRLLDPLPCYFDPRRRLTAPARRAVRIGEFLLDPWAHRRRHFGRNRRRRLIIEIDHAALARLAMRAHSARKVSTSSSLVSGPKLMQRNALEISGATPIAANTALSFILPDEQALPADTAMPARSNCTSNDALDAPGSATAPMVGRRGLSSAIITPPEAVMPSFKRARRAAKRPMS